MKKNIKKISILLICLILAVPFAMACGGSDIEFSASVLPDATVGAEYSQVIATAKCSDANASVTYALKEGSALPVGLMLRSDGTITGTPRSVADNAQFTVVASAEGHGSAEATFTLNVREGALSYTGSDDLRAAAGRDNEISVATATGAASISYALKDGSELPAGLTMAADGSGVITGTPTALGETKTFTVVATAADCTPAEASFTITVVEPWLEYAGDVISNGRVNEYYTSSVATASGARSITYALKDGSELPSGLSLSSSGLISGTPLEQVSRHTFTVVASADGYTAAEAEFTITILAASQGTADPGTITFRAEDSDIEDAYEGDEYFEEEVFFASTDNRQNVTFALADPSEFPAGLTLHPNGTIEGTPTAQGEYTFTVVASAPGCENVSAEFTFNVLAPRIVFASLTVDTATLDEAYTFSVDTAYVNDDVQPEFTYRAVDTLPAGMTLSSDGTLSGTPTKMCKRVNVTVEVSADGYTSSTADIVITVQDKIRSGVTRFEAEYWDLDGMIGGGYSGSGSGEGMIQGASAYGASNGYAITYTHSANTFTIEITSSAAVTGASLSIGMDTEIGDIVLNNSVFDVRVNNTRITYDSISVPSASGQNDSLGEFRSFLISNDIALREGVNVIEIEVLENGLRNGATYGPALDYIEFGNLGSASLSWRPKTINTITAGVL